MVTKSEGYCRPISIYDLLWVDHEYLSAVLLYRKMVSDWIGRYVLVVLKLIEIVYFSD
jgi:hypothetical protein